MTKLALLAAIAAAGCEKSGGGDAPFVGAWACKSDYTYKFTAPPNTPDQHVTLATTQTFTGTDTAVQSTSVTASGVASGCVSKWTIAHGTATVDPDQSCTAKVTTSTGALREVTSKHPTATANLVDGVLHESGAADIEIVQGSAHLVGTGSFTATCTKAK